MTVLTVILIALFLTIMVLVSKIQGTARVVNYAGLVRGKTQRIIKLEDAKEPQDEMNWMNIFRSFKKRSGKCVKRAMRIRKS